MCSVFKHTSKSRKPIICWGGQLLSADDSWLVIFMDEMEKCGFAHMINIEKTSVIYLTVLGWSVSYATRLESFCLRTLSVIIWAVMTEFWLISAPGEKTCQQTWDKMNMATTQTNLSTNHKFNIPELKVNLFHLKHWFIFNIFCICLMSFGGVSQQVGTLDVLVGLTDELAKLDSFIERF